MSVFKCKMCGGNVAFDEGATVGVCEYCGTKQTLPRLDDDRRANLYDRANHFRRNNEFDKAAGIYEQILSEDQSDAEAYWSLVLCRYGIEYVEDPSTHKRIPTVNRAQFTSVFDDENYRSALQYADGYQQELYTAEANAINEIQKGILAISRKEEPFDIFICYKETDAAGRRTPDSVLAGELYGQLTKEGFKVFFSRITLEDKLGTAYEPYIFAALHSARVMVVLGTKPEYFNAVWVKNEWSRFLALCKNDSEKALIPAYRDMDPYDLPEEFSHLQAQDMAKLGFMQDLVRGIRKIIGKDERSAPAKEVPAAGDRWSGGGNAAPLLKRAFMFLEDGDFARADEFCEQVLNIEPENADAYLGKLMAELQVRRRENLKDQKESFADSGNYKKAIRFGDEKLKAELTGAIDYLKQKAAYREATYAMETAVTAEQLFSAAEKFNNIGSYKDAPERAAKCEKTAREYLYQNAEAAWKGSKTESDYTKAAVKFEKLGNYRDAAERAKLCREKELECREKARECLYNDAKSAMNNAVSSSAYENAAKKFHELGDYRNSASLEKECTDKAEITLKKEKKKKKIILFTSLTALILLTIFSILWVNVISPALKYNKALKLTENGNLYEAAMKFETISEYKDSREQSITLWNKIADRKTIATVFFHTVGLKNDGTVVAVGDNEFGECDVSNWRDILAVSAGFYHTVRKLKNNGARSLRWEEQSKDNATSPTGGTSGGSPQDSITLWGSKTTARSLQWGRTYSANATSPNGGTSKSHENNTFTPPKPLILILIHLQKTPSQVLLRKGVTTGHGASYTDEGTV